MNDVLPVSPALTRSLALADRLAERLRVADADAARATQEVITTLPHAAVPLRRLREAHAQTADRLLGELAPTLDATWQEVEALDAALSPRDRLVAAAAWRTQVQPYFLRVPFCRRSVDKPLGYPGDYGMVNFIYDAPGSAADPLGLALERYTWEVGPCRAHRQRRPWALDHLAQVARRTPRPLRVVSFACGPEHTLQAWAASAPDTRIDLYDAEPRALDWCQARFGELTPKLGRAVDVRTHLVAPTALSDGSVTVAAPADVVLVLGLFDYLSPENLGKLVDTLAAALVPGGLLLCTNLHAPNPWRAFMERMGGWSVLHRTREQLRVEVTRDRRDLRVVDLRLDDSGTNVFCAVERLDGV